MNLTQKIFTTALTTTLTIALGFVILTLLTSRTSIIAGIRSFVVLSGSMQPLLSVGSMVYAIPQSTYKVGDIITFSDQNHNFVTHRITKINKQNNKISYVTRGDANNTNDKKSIQPSQITGRVFFFMPYIGLLINLLKTPIYFLGFVILPSISLIIYELIKIKNEIIHITEKRMLEKLKHQFI